MKTTTTRTTCHRLELRGAYDDAYSGPVLPEAHALLLAGLRAVHPDREVPDDIEIVHSGKDITFQWTVKEE